MQGKTHLVFGIATATMLVQPHTIDVVTATVIGGAIGGIMCDIDVKIDKGNFYSKKYSLDALYGEISAILLSLTLLICDYFYGGNICKTIINSWQSAAVGAVLLLILIVIGEMSNHRDKTHSILFLFLFSLSVALIHLEIGTAFFIGYLSHLFIDLFNKSPERLFYPFKKGVCLKICYADGLINDLLFSSSLCAVTCYIYFIQV